MLVFAPLLVWVSPRPHGLHLSNASLLLLFRSLGCPVLDLTPSRNATLLKKRYIAERRPELDYIEDVKCLCVSVVLKFSSAYIVCKPLHMIFVPTVNSLETLGFLVI